MNTLNPATPSNKTVQLENPTHTKKGHPDAREAVDELTSLLGAPTYQKPVIDDENYIAAWRHGNSLIAVHEHGDIFQFPNGSWSYSGEGGVSEKNRGRIQRKLEPYVDAYKVQGDTFKAKEALKKAGFAWDSGQCAWYGNDEDLERFKSSPHFKNCLIIKSGLFVPYRTQANLFGVVPEEQFDLDLPQWILGHKAPVLLPSSMELHAPITGHRPVPGKHVD